MRGLWKYDLMMLAAVALSLGAWKYHLHEEEERARAATAAGEAVAAQYAEPLLLNPICPDQWTAQRGANERWRVKCITVSTEGSRAITPTAE